MLKELVSLYRKTSLISLRYFIVFIVTFFINIFVNRLDLTTMSYFYAVILIMHFIKESGEALGDLVSIYILKKPSKSNNAGHLKTFLIFLVIFILFTSVLIIIFRNQIFNNILGIVVIDNYRFLYLMIVSYIISVPTLYLQDYLKFTSKFKEYLNTSLFFNFILITLFFGLGIFNNSIDNFAYANVIASFFTIALTFNYIRNDKKTGFDPTYLLTRKLYKFKDSLYSSVKILLQYTCMYFRIFVKSLIMIKISLELFNTNEFLLKVFWIFQGITEALITPINIKLTSLAAENKEKAFEYGKRAFKLIVINQLFLCLLYLIFRDLILGFIHPEVYIIARKVDIFLLAFSSLMIIDWALSYNILIRNNKIGMTAFLESLMFASFILFLALLQLDIISGMYLTLILMNGVVLIRIIINVIYLYSKKWL